MIKLSIGITVCGNDYKRLPSLLNQINEQVTVEHEVIIIDNTEGAKVPNATYSFGYNAYQYDARAKIIELAQGEYLWFIDGDDDIVSKIDAIPYVEDILVFSFISEPEGEVSMTPYVRSGKLLTTEIDRTIKCALWNKFIKRSLYNEQYETGVKMTTNEDTIWMYRALKNAKTLRTINRIIYRHHAGFSTKVFCTTLDDLDHLLIGYEDMVRLLKETVGEGSFFETSLESVNSYLCNYTCYIGDIPTAIRRLAEVMPYETIKRAYQQGVWDRDHSANSIAKETISSIFAKEEAELDVIEYVATFDDGHTEVLHANRNQKPFDHVAPPPPPVYEGTWPYVLSIICLVYEGNLKYLKQFTLYLEERVKVNHEVIIVDNRDDKSAELEYTGEARVITLDQNMGILDGRRAGVYASKGDYVWLVDIDDEPMKVLNLNYGDEDQLIFPVYTFMSGIPRGNDREQVVPEEDFFKSDAVRTFGVSAWNKWVKKDVAVEAYKMIPSFFCVYNEDVLFLYASLLKSESVKKVAISAIYAHIQTAEGVTTSTIHTKEHIDMLFRGWMQATRWEQEYLSFCKEVTYESLLNIVFYLRLIDNTDYKIQPYFAQTLINLYGKPRIKEALAVAEKETNGKWVPRVRRFFN